MPFPRAHRMLTLFGDAWTQSEIWQMGLRLDAPPTAQPDAAEMTALKDAFTVWWSATDQNFSYRVRMLGIKVAPVQLDGSYGDGNDAQVSLFATPVVGLSAMDYAYPQLSVVCTLLTSISRGRGSRGRFYPPPQVQSLAADGRIPAERAGVLVTHNKALIEDINDVGIGPVSVGSALGLGLLEPVTQVRCGRVIDTQRRRRNAITEEYVTTSITPP